MLTDTMFNLIKARVDGAKRGFPVGGLWEDADLLVAEIELLQRMLGDADDTSEAFKRGWMTGQESFKKRVLEKVGQRGFQHLLSSVVRDLQPIPYNHEEHQRGSTS